MLRVKKIKTTK